MSAISSKEITAHTQQLYREVLAFTTKAQTAPPNAELFQAGFQLDLRITQTFQRVAEMPIGKQNVNSCFRLSEARDLLLKNGMSIQVNRTTSMQMLSCARNFSKMVEIFDETSPSLLRRVWTDQGSLAVFDTFDDADQQDVYRTIWALSGKPSGDPLLIGRTLFKTNHSELRALKIESIVMVAAKKTAGESEDAQLRLRALKHSLDKLDMLRSIEYTIERFSQEKERFEKRLTRVEKDLYGLKFYKLNNSIPNKSYADYTPKLKGILNTLKTSIAFYDKALPKLFLQRNDLLEQQSPYTEAMARDLRLKVEALNSLKGGPGMPMGHTSADRKGLTG